DLAALQVGGAQVAAQHVHHGRTGRTARRVAPGHHAQAGDGLAADAATECAVEAAVLAVFVGAPPLAQQQHRVAGFEPARQRSPHGLGAAGLGLRRFARS
ncbi:hypothetical protein RZS08_38755, partial [Arthrospira platensis SPKY1]|nr:hypothetical protein [Arthrospira platensis SPKY1]